MTRNQDDNRLSRRTVLRSTAVGSVAAFGATMAAAQDDEGISPGTIELGGRRSGWVGQSPDSIADETNPTLQLQEGETYQVVWENLDGDIHNFVIEDEDGENLLSTDTMSDRGETQEVPEFEATSEMAEYYCAPHSGSMRGDIELVGGDGGGGETEDGNEGGEDYFSEGPTIGLETVAEGLTAPTSFAVADEDADRRFVTDQTGQVYVHGEDGLEDEPFLDIQDRMVDLQEDFDERGLLDIAFHPDFSENGRFFVRYSAPADLTEETPEEYDHTFVVAEFQTDGDDNETADPESERIVMTIPQPQFNHNAGPLEFGPEGYLYIAVGDGGGAHDIGDGHVEDWYDENEGGNGQDTSENLLGSILRIDVDEEGDDDRAYGIPDDNPLVDEEDHLPEHYAWGLRNPWGMSFHEGQLIAADVGQALWEEINVIEQGGNYGWNVKEGTHCFSPDSPEESPEECPDGTPDDVRGGESFVDPVIEYPHTNEDQQIGVSVTGGRLYEGDSIDDLEGAYVFGDWSQNGADPVAPLLVAYPPEGWADSGDGMGSDGEDGMAGNETDEMAGNETDEMAGNETDDGLAGNDSDGNGGLGGDNESDDEMVGNESDGGMADGDGEGGSWEVERLLVDGELAAENGRLGGFVWAFGQDSDGEVYVLTSQVSGPREETGAIHRIVSTDGGETDDGGESDDMGGNESDDGLAGNETDGAEDNETAAEGENVTADNETDGAND